MRNNGDKSTTSGRSGSCRSMASDDDRVLKWYLIGYADD